MNILLKQKTIISKARLCATAISRLQGYMYSKKPAYSALIFPDCTGLHMFFCFFPLLIIVLDKNQIIQDMYILKPWQLGPIYLPGKLLVETPNLKLREKLKNGDKLKFQPKLKS